MTINLVDRLLKADAKKAGEYETAEFESKRLAKILEAEDEAISIELTGINPRLITDITAYQLDSNGKADFSKTFDGNLMICIEGIKSPDLRDKDLQAHFGTSSAKDLCEKLFGFEAVRISQKISELSGVSDDDDEAEIKN